MNDYSGWDKASSLVDVGVTMSGRTHMFFTHAAIFPVR